MTVRASICCQNRQRCTPYECTDRVTLLRSVARQAPSAPTDVLELCAGRHRRRRLAAISSSRGQPRLPVDAQPSRPPPVSRQVRSATDRAQRLFVRPSLRCSSSRSRGRRSWRRTLRRRRQIGSDISAFNCLLGRAKTTRQPRRTELLRAAAEEARRAGPAPIDGASEWLRSVVSLRRLCGELLALLARSVREHLDDPPWDVAKIVLSRAARIRTAHHPLRPRFSSSPDDASRTSATSTSARAGPWRRRRSFSRATQRDTIRRIRILRRGSDEPRASMSSMSDSRTLRLSLPASTASSRRRRTRA